MNPGLMRHPITLQKSAKSQDAIGQPIEEWTDCRTVFASRRKISGSSKDHSDRANEVQDVIFRVRSQPAIELIEQGGRFTFGCDTYLIISVVEAGERDEYLDIQSRKYAKRIG